MKLKLRLMSTLFAASMLVCNAGALSCGETLPENGVTNAATECTVEGSGRTAKSGRYATFSSPARIAGC